LPPGRCPSLHAGPALLPLLSRDSGAGCKGTSSLPCSVLLPPLISLLPPQVLPLLLPFDGAWSRVRTVRLILLEGELSAPIRPQSSAPSRWAPREMFGVIGGVAAGELAAGERYGEVGSEECLELEGEELGVLEEPEERERRKRVNLPPPDAASGERACRPVIMSMHDVSSRRPRVWTALATILSATRSQPFLPTMDRGTILAMTPGPMASQTPSDATQMVQPPSGMVWMVVDGAGDT